MPWKKAQLRSKVRGKTTIHFTACEENVQLLLKTVMSVKQLSLYGAVADMIQELPEDQVAPGRPVASDQTEQEILIQPPIAEAPSNDERQETSCKITSKDLKDDQKTRNYLTYAPKQV